MAGQADLGRVDQPPQDRTMLSPGVDERAHYQAEFCGMVDDVGFVERAWRGRVRVGGGRHDEASGRPVLEQAGVGADSEVVTLREHDERVGCLASVRYE